MLPPAARIQYEQHPVTGQAMLSSVEQRVEIATWIRHEPWDGHGYPDRLAGPAIPMPSRLIAVADGDREGAWRGRPRSGLAGGPLGRGRPTRGTDAAAGHPDTGDAASTE